MIRCSVDKRFVSIEGETVPDLHRMNQRIFARPTRAPQSPIRKSPDTRIALLYLGIAAAILSPDSQAAVLVDLDATQLPVGEQGTWENRGTLPGNFETAGLSLPQVIARDEVRGVLFPASTDPIAGAHYVGPTAPWQITGGGARTVEAWIYDSSPQPEKVVVAWGHRGGPDGSNCSFGHGTDPGFGAVAHWGNPGPDLGWNQRLVFNAWTHIAYTFDGEESRTYQDGQLATVESMVLNTWQVDDNGLPVPIRIARQNSRIGTPSSAGIGEIVVARLRIHDRALAASELEAAFADERADFGLNDPDQDGLPTWFEKRFDFLDPSDGRDGALDQDEDGLNNLGEFQAGTDLLNPDTDQDGLADGEEIFRIVNGTNSPTNALVKDSDQDGLSDLVETLLGTDPNQSDTDRDGFSDGQEVLHLSNALSDLSTPDLTEGSPVIELNLTRLPLGPALTLPNTGFLDGDFITTASQAEIVVEDGVRGLKLAGGERDFYTGPIVPEFLAHDHSRSIEAWIFNPSLEEQETVISWGRRGGPDGTHLSLNHGNSPTTGAAVHWRQPDLGWRDRATAGRWTYLAYVHSAEESAVRVYADGTEASSTSGIILDTWPVDDQSIPRGLPFRLGCQNNSDGTPAPGFRASLTLGRLRVYDRALSSETILENYRRDLPEFGKPRFNNVTFNPLNQTMSLRWEESIGRVYSIEGSSDAVEWNKLGIGTEGHFQVPILPEVRLRYFRLRAE